jgi:hypothetical protein
MLTEYQALAVCLYHRTSLIAGEERTAGCNLYEKDIKSKKTHCICLTFDILSDNL